MRFGPNALIAISRANAARTGEVVDSSRLPRGTLDPHNTRAAQAPIALQRGWYGRTAFVLGLGKTGAEAFGQYRRVLDRHASALRGKRQHGVCGIAQQSDRAIGPSAAVGYGEQRPFAPVVDGADHHPRRSGPPR